MLVMKANPIQLIKRIGIVQQVKYLLTNKTCTQPFLILKELNKNDFSCFARVMFKKAKSFTSQLINGAGAYLLFL